MYACSCHKVCKIILFCQLKNDILEKLFHIEGPNNGNADISLVAELSPGQVSIVAVDNEKKIIHSWLYYTYAKNISQQERNLELDFFLENEAFFQQPFSSIHACCNSRETVLIPQEFYSGPVAMQAITLQYGYTNPPSIHSNSVKSEDAYIAYTWENTALDTWLQKFPLSIRHHSSALLLQASIHEGDYMQCYISARWLKVIAFKDGVLQLLQNFPFETPADAAYHLLNTFAQTGLDPKENSLVIFGLIDEDSSLYVEIYKYFVHIRFQENVEPFTLDEGLKEIPLRYYSALIQMAKCV
ncbi:MAG: DUF3822 family protein [Ferruginibacter sp.]